VDHRELAVELFNSTWDLLDRTDRTPVEDLEMVHRAHASRYHWGVAGDALNWARGEWQISRVYAVIGRAEGATVHARRSLDLCLEHGYGDFDLAFAYEALARASAVAGDTASRDTWLTDARAATEQIADPEDRAMVEGDLDAIAAL
jgi:hypothetical protein